MSSHLCNYCRKPAELICVRCRDRYCSRACQDIDWPQHKLFCFPMPSLVRPPTSEQSEPLAEPLRPPSPSSKYRNLKLTTENEAIPKATQQSLLDKSSTNGFAKSNGITTNNAPAADNSKSNSGQQTSPQSKDNIPKSNDSAKDNGISPNNVPAADTKQDVKSSIKPAYVKTEGRIDATSIRKPGILADVLPKQTPVMPSQPPKPVSVEPPKPQQKVEPPKQPIIQPPKPKIEPPKPTTEPPKQKIEPQKPTTESAKPKTEPAKPTTEPPKPKVEPPKPKVEPPKPKVEPPKPKVEPPKPKVEPPKQQSLESPKTGPWMTPFPMEENVFVEAMVQYVAPNGTAWVSLTAKDGDNTQLLRKCNKIVSVASTPSSADIQVNSLFLVPFEDLYYRGVVLRPVTANDKVLVRLVDYGNEVELQIDQLKSALPSVCELNAYAFPIKFKKPRTVEFGMVIKIKKVATENDIITVIVEGDVVELTPDVITMKDVDVVPIAEGSKQDLICLDTSNVRSGYVSLCNSNKKALKFIEDMGLALTKYCSETAGEHCPHETELCLAKFEEDGWFRALTLKALEPKKFQILFIDYGNIITVNSSDIRKITDEFTHPCLMNKCYLKGFPKAPTEEDISKVTKYFDEHPAFCADKVEKDGDKLFLTVQF